MVFEQRVGEEEMKPEDFKEVYENIQKMLDSNPPYPTEPDVESVWRDFWMQVLVTSATEKGIPLFEAIKLELFDYKNQMDAWSKTLYTLTNGKLSKTNYTSEVMIAQITDAFNEDKANA